MPEGKLAFTIVVVLLIGAPLLGEHLSNRPVRRAPTVRLERAEAVARTHSDGTPDALTCFSTTKCMADLDGDGISGIAEVVPLASSFYPNNRGLLVIEGHRELMWKPFRSDGTAPTRIAVIEDSYGTRLLVSDVSCPDLHEAAFEWNGAQLVKLPLTESERDALQSANSLDDYSGADRYVRVYQSGSEVTPDRLGSVVKLFFYYMVLVILSAVMLYRKSVRWSAAPSLFAKGKP